VWQITTYFYRHMVGSLLILGFTLSLDNFRTAIALGGLRPNWRRSLHIAVMFGFWDGVAPLVGIIIGHYWSESIGETGEIIGAVALGLYGLYLVIRACVTPAADDLDQPWAIFGLLVPLSLDNVVAGASLGLLGVTPWLAPVVFGLCTFVMALVGLQVGRAAAHVIRIRPDLLTGVALVAMAVILGPRA
jgi:putative Mn2+ efflux pump MntP